MDLNLSSDKPVVVVSVGDMNGIGPEVTCKALNNMAPDLLLPVLAGPAHVFRKAAKPLGISWNPITLSSHAELRHHLRGNRPESGPNGTSALTRAILLDTTQDLLTEFQNDTEPVPSFGSTLTVQPGSETATAGRIAMQAVTLAAELCMKGTADAMVTAPISKKAISMAGYTIPGHTGYLAACAGRAAEDVLMTLVSRDLRVALVTEHIPVHQISNHLSKDLIFKKLSLLHHSLIFDHGIPSPRIAVLGLNPHAGDQGVLGSEEIDIIQPAIQHASEMGLDVQGPYPADAYFGMKKYHQTDAVLAMYHDQGLAPFKALTFGGGVNMTAGLPFVRTSPDHGTAFDIAGRGTASADSMSEAIKMAVRCSQNRKSKMPDHTAEIPGIEQHQPEPNKTK